MAPSRNAESAARTPDPLAISATGSAKLAPDCRGMNFFAADRSLQDLLGLYMEGATLARLRPHMERLGALAGGRLGELAETADKHPPVLHPRDRFGRDEPWIEYHPAYREMEAIGFGEFGLHAMPYRSGVLGEAEPFDILSTFVFQYLFCQAEFGLCCPINLTQSSAMMLARFGDENLKAKFLPRMLEQDMDRLWRASQFMTEKAGGSDVGQNALTAVRDGEIWRLYGDKWFCSSTDAEVALLLARPQGAPEGTKGLALFLMPKLLDDGSRNRYRIVRLKDKLGSKSMASGEIVFDGAEAYPVGDIATGFKQMMYQVNHSRLSHGVRAASMMRRCLNEAMAVARGRHAFGGPLERLPLMRRQLLKLVVPTEQALSMMMATAQAYDRADAGDAEAETLLRILTPLIKYRACRDNIGVATGAMEVRGGNGYIEDWANPRLVRDGHLGVLWEGTSNIVALDVVTRAVAKVGAHAALCDMARQRLDEGQGIPGQFRGRLAGLLDRAATLAEEVARRPEREMQCRKAAGALYHAVSAAILAAEGAALGRGPGGDARRLLLARLVVEHRLAGRDPLALDDAAWESEAAALLLGEEPVPLQRAAELVAA